MPHAPSQVPVERVEVAAYRVPTEQPESDGTLSWDSTTLVLVQVHGGGRAGLGYTYADAAAAQVVHDRLAPLVQGQDAFATRARWRDMRDGLRNLGQTGIGALALSAVDVALWDLKARCLDCSLATLLGPVRDAVDVYGSGGFTSYTVPELQRQLADWADAGIGRVKMKVGREREQDRARVGAARQAVGPGVQLFMDANGAYTRCGDRKQALAFAWGCAEHDVRWFEEPVSSDDLDGLRMLRNQGPPAMAISAGEYGWEAGHFHRLLQAGAVDVLQADATRCGGITGFMDVAAQCSAWQVPLSSHCAPALHLPLGCAAEPLLHIEYFHDHARIERMLFDGAIAPTQGRLGPDLLRPGLGLDFKQEDAECFRL